jgi:hypothetical protein
VPVENLNAKSIKADIVSSDQKKKINSIFDLMKYENTESKKKEFCKELYGKETLTKFTNDEANNFIEKLKQGLRKRIVVDNIYSLQELTDHIEAITDVYNQDNPADQKILDEIVSYAEHLTETKKEAVRIFQNLSFNLLPVWSAALRRHAHRSRQENHRTDHHESCGIRSSQDISRSATRSGVDRKNP